MNIELQKAKVLRLERLCNKFEEQGNSFAFDEAYCQLEKARKELKGG